MLKKIIYFCICWMAVGSAHAINISYIPAELQKYYTPLDKELSYPDYPLEQGDPAEPGSNPLASQRMRLVHIDPHVLKTIEQAREGVEFLKDQGFNALISEHSRYLMRDVESVDDSEFHVLKTQPFDELVSTHALVAQAAHENGMKFYLHLTYGMVDDELATQHPEWLIRNVVTGEISTNRYGVTAACFNDDEFFGVWSNRFEQLLLGSNADGAMVDEIQFFSVTECGCSDCIAKFEAATGLELPEDRTNWLLDIADPVYKQWIMWRKATELSRRMDVAEIITDSNPDGVCLTYSANPADLSDHMHYTAFSYDDYPSYTQSIGQESEPPISEGYGHLNHYYPHSIIYEMKYNQAVAQKTGNGYWTLFYGARAGSEHQPGWNVRAWLMALSQGSGLWYLQYSPWLQKSQLAWEKKHQALLPYLSPYADVSIPVSVSSQTWVPDVEGHPGNLESFSSLCTAMQDSHVPHRLITDLDLESGDFIEDTQLLLAMNLTALSTNSMESIRSFVAQGGTVVLSGESSMYDEMGNKRGNFGLSDLIGADYVDSVNSSSSFVIDGTNNVTGDFTGELQPTYGFVRVESILPEVEVLGYILDSSNNQYPGILSREYGLGRVVYFAGYPDAKYFIGHGYHLNRIEVNKFWQDKRDEDYLSLLSKMVHQLVPDMAMQVENLPKRVLAEVYRQDTPEIEGYQVHLLNLLDTELQTGVIAPPPPLVFPSVQDNLPDVNQPITIKVKSSGIQGVFFITPDFDEIVELPFQQSGEFTQVELPYFYRYAMLYFVEDGVDVITQLAGGAFAGVIPACKSIGEIGEEYPPVGGYDPNDAVFFVDSGSFLGGRLSLVWPTILRYAIGKGGGDDLVVFNFDLDEVTGPLAIDICAKNNNSSIKAPMSLRLNGTEITSWENGFPYNNLAVQRIMLPANLLNPGGNSLVFENHGQGPLLRAPWFAINFIRIAYQVNAIPYSETFESYTNGFSMLGGVPGWVAASGTDALVSTNPALVQPLNAYGEPCGYPVPSAAHAKVLEVDGTVSNYFDMATNQVVWADQMAMSVHGPLPTDTNLLAGVQAAVAFSQDNHPAVWHYDLAGGTNRWSVADDVTVSTGEWVRLTYTFDYQTDDAVNNIHYFQVRVNGNLLTNALAWTVNDGLGSTGGSWFAMSSEPDRLNWFSCRGGSVVAMDDLVVTTDNPLAREVEIASAHGQADPAVGTYSHTYGDTVALSLTNSTIEQGTNQFAYTGWDMAGHAPASGADTSMQITLTNDLVLTWLWATNNAQTSQGTPIWWLASHGLTEVDDLVDGDYDGILTWQEWTSDTVPNNSNSVLKITDIAQDGAGMKVYWKGGVQATQVLEQRTNLVSGTDWKPLLTNLPPTLVTNSYSDSAVTNRAGFYRFKVWR